MKRFVHAGSGMILTIGIFGLLFAGCSDDSLAKRYDISSYVYHGSLGTNTVEIDDWMASEGFIRIVHVKPVNQPSYVGITGHSSKAIGQWQRIFYCGGLPDSSYHGCNSVVYNWETGVWDFEPCDADRGRVKPFTDEQILFAIRQLNEAMAEVYNKEHLIRVWKNPDLK